MNKAVIYGLGILLFLAAFLISVVSTKPHVSDVPAEIGETAKAEGRIPQRRVVQNKAKSFHSAFSNMLSRRLGEGYSSEEPNLNDHENRLRIARLGISDPDEALKYIRETVPRADRKKYLDSFLADLGFAKGQEAIAWAEGKGLSPAYFEQIYEGWAMADHVSAAKHLEQNYRRGLDVDDIYEALAINCANKAGLDGLDQWVGDMENPVTRKKMAKEMLNMMYEQDGDRTLEWISENLEKSYAVDGVMDVVRSEARADPEGTGNWVRGLESNDMKASLLTTVVRVWSKDNPAAPVDFLFSLPETREYDPVIASYSREISKADPATSMIWASFITNESMRERVMYEVALEGAKADRRLVDSTLNSEWVPEEVRTRVLRDLPSSSPGRTERRQR